MHAQFLGENNPDQMSAVLFYFGTMLLAWHQAIPAAAASLLLLKDATLKSGEYFMYEPLNISEFISFCMQMGLEIKVVTE